MNTPNVSSQPEPHFEITVRSSPMLITLLLVTATLLPLTIVMWVKDGLGAGILMAAIWLMTAAVVGLFASITLRITDDQLAVRSTLLGFPMKRIKLTDIQAVSATTLRPYEWGGWGYRIKRGGAALLLQGGPGFVVTLAESKQFSMSLTNPDPAIAAIQAALQPNS